jgi:hypothetical protein|tara:strand:+ start:610 stop:789 length:180 start_codon:yes stop_codon:yes gene_type:complete
MVDNKKTREFVDQASSGDNVAAGDTFSNLMKDKQLDAIDLKRIETQLDWLGRQEKSAEE